MQRFFIGLALTWGMASLAASAAEYPRYDLQQLLKATDTPRGKRYTLDGAYMDRVMQDLVQHAAVLPVRFDSERDRLRALHDLRVMALMLEQLLQDPQAPTELQLRAGLVYSLQQNLQVRGAPAKAVKTFERLLTKEPENARANLLFGMFLSSGGMAVESIGFLEKAAAAGLNEAEHALALAWNELGDQAKAQQHLERYLQREPGDMEAVRWSRSLRSSGKAAAK